MAGVADGEDGEGGRALRVVRQHETPPDIHAQPDALREMQSKMYEARSRMLAEEEPSDLSAWAADPQTLQAYEHAFGELEASSGRIRARA